MQQRLLELNICSSAWHKVAFSRPPCIPCSGYGHLTRFWPMAHKQKKCVLHHGACHSWSSLSFPASIWMDWALRMVELEERRSPGGLNERVEKAHVSTALGGAAARNRHGLKLGLFMGALSLCWPFQWGLSKRTKAIYCQRALFFPKVHVSSFLMEMNEKNKLQIIEIHSEQFHLAASQTPPSWCC